MNTLVVCLGGTIASNVNSDNIVELGDHKFNTNFFEKIMPKVKYRIISPVMYSSENADIATYRKALKGIYDAVAEERPDSILILHGTDSMANFAQLAVRVLSMLKIPVVITGSKIPASEPGSDAKKNIQMALGFLDAAVEGNVRNKTFGVVFNDSFTGVPSFVAAQQITASDIKGDYKPYDCPRTDYSETKYIKKAVDFLTKEDSEEDNVLVIPAVPSFPYEAISGEGYGPVLIEAYHSGTADSVKIPEFIARVGSDKHKFYLAPVPATLTAGKKPSIYESTAKLKKLGVELISNMPVEGAWAEIVALK